LVAQYGHHVPNCLSPRLLHRTLAWSFAMFCLICGRTWSFPVAQTATVSISAAWRQLPFTTVTFFLNKPHTCNCFLLGPPT
jgi:hypothetical protein